MKKTYSPYLITFVLLLLNIEARATTHMVTVENYFFTPSSMTVTVGDTIKWNWLSGSHTTTSTTIPAGAATWNSSINSISPSFSYVVTAAGTYDYECAIHPTLMIGNFTATVGAGISPVMGNLSLIVNSTLLSNELQITYTLQKPSPVILRLLDLGGKQLDNFSSAYHTPGTFTETYSINLSRGMYLLEFRTADMIASRKIVIE